MERARILFEQQRFEATIAEVERELARNPENSEARALLAMAHSELGRHREARDEARRAVALQPDSAFPHYALAHVLLAADDPRGADAAAREALRLAPRLAAAHAALASALFGQSRWQEALAAAEAGLEAEPRSQACLNLRALALRQLGRTPAAADASAAAIANDPEDAMAHATAGWTMLERRAHAEALERFREALRLQPDNELARSGIVEALKARYAPYRALLRYYLWTSKLSRGAQLGLWIGLFFLVRLLRGAASRNPELTPVAGVVLFAYGAFALSTWLGSTVFDTALRLNPFGRIALDDDQRHASDLLVAFGGGAVALGFLAVALRSPVLAGAAFGSAAMTVPATAVFSASGRRSRRVRAAAAGALLVCGVVALGAAAVGSREVAAAATVAFVLGWIGFTWLAAAFR